MVEGKQESSSALFSSKRESRIASDTYHKTLPSQIASFVGVTLRLSFSDPDRLSSIPISFSLFRLLTENHSLSIWFTDSAPWFQMDPINVVGLSDIASELCCERVSGNEDILAFERAW